MGTAGPSSPSGPPPSPATSGTRRRSPAAARASSPAGGPSRAELPSAPMRRWAWGLVPVLLATAVAVVDPTPAAAGSHPPLDGAIQLSVGTTHSCAVLEDHQVRCWGDNANGEL